MSLKKLRRKLEQNAPLTVADYQQLADHCMALLDEVAAIIPRLAEAGPTRPSTVTAHLSIPTVFLRTAIDSVEQIRELEVVRLDVHRGRNTLQLVETFRPVRDKLAAFDRDLVNVLNARRSSLTVEALGTYHIAKSLARGSSDTALIACVDNMKRSLGPRGRPKKT